MNYFLVFKNKKKAGGSFLNSYGVLMLFFLINIVI